MDHSSIQGCIDKEREVLDLGRAGLEKPNSGRVLAFKRPSPLEVNVEQSDDDHHFLSLRDYPSRGRVFWGQDIENYMAHCLRFQKNQVDENDYGVALDVFVGKLMAILACCCSDVISRVIRVKL